MNESIDQSVDSLAALRPQLAILPVTYLTSHELRDQLKQTLEEIKGAAEEYIGKKKGKKRGDGQASEAREEEARKADWMDSEGASYLTMSSASTSGSFSDSSTDWPDRCLDMEPRCTG